mmetsp:Transcript_11323/g.18437  ORF Transcript_11323/g.18437 Transcript_11323/m.18437 type:complete len:345 (+) Transcript_11323:171-1205(+)
MSETSGLFKFTILALISFQTAASSILTQYCRGVRKETFSNVEMVVMGETIKMCISVVLTLWQTDDPHSLPNPVIKKPPWYSRLLSLLMNSKKVIVLVILYSISNICNLTAVEFIGAPMYTVCCQMKIFTTAAFGVLLLGKSYSSAKWRALLLLIIGCLMVSSPILRAVFEPDPNQQGERTDMYGHSTYEQLYGLAAVTLQFTISGFASVYFEGMLKNKEDAVSIWERNFQLAFYSILFLALSSYFKSSYDYMQGQTTQAYAYEPFAGWTAYSAGLCVMNAIAGLLVAATLKYADAVLKCFATAVAIIITSVLSYLLLGSSIDVFAALGMITTVLSIFNYALDTD